MIGFFTKAAGYEEQKSLAASPDAKERLRLARNPKTHLEILYYLAADEDQTVRQAVASNKSTPMQAAPLLAKDDGVDVKLALMKRLVKLLPELSAEQHTKLYAFAAQALGYLALDEVLKVRLALSSSLRDLDCAPPEVVARLARDAEREVAEPILRYCMALPDADLIDILNEHPDAWVVEAVARRPVVSEKIAGAVVSERQRKANQYLLENPHAEIDEDTLYGLIAQARDHPEWHRPLALRKHLPPPFVKEILNFVDGRLQKKVLERADLTPETRAELHGHIKRRMAFLVDDKGARIEPADKATVLFKAGKLGEEAVMDALSLREFSFVRRAIALKAGISDSDVERVLALRVAKPLVAIVWKAGLSMNAAFTVQKQMLRLMPKDLMYPKGGDYPLERSEIEWQLDFLGL